MAGGQERVLKRRIKSIQSTKKITKAFELIAASRIVKAMVRMNDARPYFEAMSHVVHQFTSSAGLPKSKYIVDPIRGDRAILVITADRGLCGAYNSAPLRLLEKALIQSEAEVGASKIKVIAVGKKAIKFLAYRSIEVSFALSGVTERPTYEHARQIASSVFELYDNEVVTTVDIISTRFFSAGKQKLEVVPILPVDPNALVSSPTAQTLDFEIEPSAEGLIDPLIRSYVEEKIFGLLLEAAAAEQAYRQRAMKAATENAQDLISKYTIIMNRARQDSITTEIMEIIGGAEAMKAGKKAKE